MTIGARRGLCQACYLVAFLSLCACGAHSSSHGGDRSASVFSGGDKGGMSGADRSREVGGDSRYSGENAVVAYSGGSGGRHGGSGGRQTGGGFIVSEEAFVNALGVIAKSFDVISDVMEFLKEESTSDADVDTRIANIKKMRESVSKRKPAFAGRGSLALPWS